MKRKEQITNYIDSRSGDQIPCLENDSRTRSTNGGYIDQVSPPYDTECEINQPQTTSNVSVELFSKEEFCKRLDRLIISTQKNPSNIEDSLPGDKTQRYALKYI